MRYKRLEIMNVPALSREYKFAAAFVLAIAALFVLSIFVYAVGSFILMARHVERRSLRRALRELAREVWFSIWTQPFLPLFYLIGRRLHRGDPNRVPIVFVHGYLQNRVDFVRLSRALVRNGLGSTYGFNYPWFLPIPSNALRLEQFVRRVCEETGSRSVDLVCHSLGGLVAVEMMRSEAKRATLKVRRCVTIACPHAGIVWRGPLFGRGATSLRRGSELLLAHAGEAVAVPSLSVFSSHDNVVFPKVSSSLLHRGGRDIEVEGLAHLSILFDDGVAAHVASFLAEPDPV